MHCEVTLNALKLHFLDHRVENFKRFGSFNLLNISAFQRFNVYTKRAYQSKSQRQGRVLEETASVLDAMGHEIIEDLIGF